LDFIGKLIQDRALDLGFDDNYSPVVGDVETVGGLKA
jgi:hypothetical protein